MNRPKFIVSHPTGNANVRAVVKGFAEAGILHKFLTTIATFPGDLLYKMGSLQVFKEVRRRSYDPFLKPYTKKYPFYEIGRLIAGKIGLDSLISDQNGFFCIDKVSGKLDKKVASKVSKAKNNGVIGIYAYEYGAVHTFKEAKKNGLSCFYDLPIGYWRSKKKMLIAEKKRRPQWAGTIQGLYDSDAKLARKDEEIKLADHIFVASTFTKKTLNEYPGPLPPVHVIPYGFPEPLEGRSYSSLQNRCLKILFVGGLSQRKGIADLFEAVNKMGDHVELTIVGKKAVKNCNALNKNLSKHNWIPSLSHDKVLDLMSSHDIFLFPSLFEGFGLVITEAMSQGTPVITTERTAGPDIINHQENGWIVNAGSSEAIEYQLEKILKQPSCIEEVGRAAMQTAEKRSWADYGRELAESIILCSKESKK